MYISAEKYVFHWNGISILQNDLVLKIGTDAILLGAWIPGLYQTADQILDAGTGTGIIALMMAYKFSSAKITAIDNDIEAVMLAGWNFQNSIWSERLTVLHEDLLSGQKEEKYDMVVCNPPYYYNQFVAQSKKNVNGKHSTSPVTIWIKELKSYLKTQGHLFLILPYTLTFHWIRAANALGMYCNHRLNVYSYENDTLPVRSLIDLSNKLTEPSISKLVVYQNNKCFTPEYQAFSGIGLPL